MPQDPAKPVPVDDPDIQNIDVPDDSDTPSADKNIDIDAADQDAEDFKKLDNKAFAAMRKEAADAKRERDDLRREVATLTKKPAAVNPPAQPFVDPNRRREMIGGIVVPENKQEWDALARTDWQSAVDLRSIINARKVADEVRKNESSARSLDDAKNKVLQKHPELADANSEKGQIFLKILDRNPDYLSMSKGPIIAMYEMEAEMESLGYTRDQIFDTKKAVAQADATRVSRGSLTGAGRMPEKTGRTVQLSKDDMEFCKTQGIDPVDYAKQRLELENQRKGAQL